jgi:hypothetical protein
LLELESFVDDLTLVVTTEGAVELETCTEDLAELECLTSVELEDVEMERELVVDTLRLDVDVDFATVLLLSFLVELLLTFLVLLLRFLVLLLLLILLELLLLLLFLVPLTIFEEPVVFCRLEVEDLAVDVGFGDKLLVLLDDDLVDDDVALRLEDEVENDSLLEEVLILLDDEVVFLLVGDWTLVVLVIALVDEALLVAFVDEVFLVEMPLLLEEMGFSLTQLQSAIRLGALYFRNGDVVLGLRVVSVVSDQASIRTLTPRYRTCKSHMAG